MSMIRKEQGQAIKFQEVILLRDHTTGKAGSLVKLSLSSAKMLVEDMGIAKYKGKAQEAEIKQIVPPTNKQIKVKKIKK